VKWSGNNKFGKLMARSLPLNPRAAKRSRGRSGLALTNPRKERNSFAGFPQAFINLTMQRLLDSQPTQNKHGNRTRESKMGTQSVGV
jgi:hypothetical protein